MYALITCCLDECSQLYHAPWIDLIRSTTLGHLVLGSGFIWGDFVAYAIGVGAGALGEIAMRSVMAARTKSTPGSSKGKAEALPYVLRCTALSAFSASCFIVFSNEKTVVFHLFFGKL